MLSCGSDERGDTGTAARTCFTYPGLHISSFCTVSDVVYFLRECILFLRSVKCCSKTRVKLFRVLEEKDVLASLTSQLDLQSISLLAWGMYTSKPHECCPLWLVGLVCCPSLLSAAVTSTMTESSLVKEGFISAHRFQTIIERSQSKKLSRDWKKNHLPWKCYFPEWAGPLHIS